MEWINVKDSLPQDRIQAVLVFNGDAPLYNQCVTQATWYLEMNDFRRCMNGEFLGTITHWMPLPEPPKNQ